MLKKSPLPNQIAPSVAWNHIDATNTDSITKTGSHVVSVLNLSGNNNNLTQTVSGSRPQTGIQEHNGLNVINFDGTRFLNFDNNTPASEPFTVIFVGQSNATTGIQAFIGRQTSNIAGQWVSRREAFSGAFNTFAFGSGGLSSQVAQASNNNANIHCIKFQNGSSISYTLNNNTTAVGVARTGYDNAVATGLAVGASNSSGTTPLSGWIGEIIIYNGILTASETTALAEYLSVKLGITLAS